MYICIICICMYNMYICIYVCIYMYVYIYVYRSPHDKRAHLKVALLRNSKKRYFMKINLNYILPGLSLLVVFFCHKREL